MYSQEAYEMPPSKKKIGDELILVPDGFEVIRVGSVASGDTDIADNSHTAIIKTFVFRFLVLLDLPAVLPRLLPNLA